MFLATESECVVLARSSLAQADSVTDWITALATGLTFVVAALALFFAYRQLHESKDSRIQSQQAAAEALQQTREIERERAQPYVLATMELDELDPTIVSLVIRNYGATIAKNIVVDINPAPQRSINDVGEKQEVLYPKEIPALAPSQHWSTLWDTGRERAKSDLPDLHLGQVTYTGLYGEELETPIVLDWSIYKSKQWVERRGIHDIAKALRGINETTKKWSKTGRGSLSVFVRDGDAKDERSRQEAEEWQQRTASGQNVTDE